MQRAVRRGAVETLRAAGALDGVDRETVWPAPIRRSIAVMRSRTASAARSPSP
jgi:hypothetical protein